MWIFIGVILAFAVWIIFKLSIISLYALFFTGIILGTIPYFIKGHRQSDRK